MRVLFINWPREEKALLKSLTTLGVDVSTISVAEFALPRIVKSAVEMFNAVYISLTGPRALTSLCRILPTMSPRELLKTIIGILEPLFAYLYRPRNALYNVRSVIGTLCLLMKRPRAVHVLNSHDARLIGMLGIQVYPIPYGVDLSLVPTGVEKDDVFTMIYVMPEYRKGGDIAYRTIRYILGSIKNVRARIVLGRGYLRNLFLELQQRYPSNVEIYSWLPRIEFYRLLARSHVLLFPSRWETFGRVVLDSLASGTPVIAFDIPGAPQDILAKYIHLGIGYVAERFDETDFIRGILYYYKLWTIRNKEYTSIAKVCKIIAERYSVERIALIFKQMLDKTLRDI